MKIGIIPINVGVSSVDTMIGLAHKAEALDGLADEVRAKL